MEEMNIKISDGYEMIAGKLEGWIAALIKMLPNFAVAILILLVFVFIGKMLRKLVLKMLPKVSESTTLNELVGRILYITIICAGSFVALSVLNLDKAVTSLLAGAGIIGLALGFAFQDIAANFMSGIIMAVKKPFRVGDLVETNGIFGKIQSLHLRATHIQNPQGQNIIVPNKMVFENPIKNYNSSGKRRVDLECGVSYGDDLKLVRDVTTKAIEELDCVDNNLGVTFFFTEFGGSSINFAVRYWVKSPMSQGDYLNALSEGVIAVKAAFDQNGIDIPFPIRTLDFGIKGGEKLSEMMVVGKED